MSAKHTPLSTMDINHTPRWPKRAVITAGMPYGNKTLHFGHIAGVFVPADFFARFLRDRIGAHNVLFVSGTDCYGSPIMEGFRKQGEALGCKTLPDYIAYNHNLQKRALNAYDISLNYFGGSALDPARAFHATVTKEVLSRLQEKGYLIKRDTLQFYDTQAHTFLNGRQVSGTCPVRGCKSEHAYADECDMGHQFDPKELINPTSELTGTKPELKPVENVYFALDRFWGGLQELANLFANDPQVRAVVTQTMQESLLKPRLFIKCELRAEYEAIAHKLPAHTLIEPQGNQQSFSVEFENWEERDAAEKILDDACIRYRAGKCLLPLRITGNIDWGVPAAGIEGADESLTVWVWPESLWAPISFTRCALESSAASLSPDTLYDATPLAAGDWRDWWASEDAQVFQFIGQDNIYFYCMAQPAIWKALDWNLTIDTPVANYHVLFLNKKASSSSEIKPPMADELLDFYTAEQLRCHWLSLGLDTKAVSFSPKPFDTTISHVDKKTGAEVLVKDDSRVSDPALKESAFLTNIFNRLARSCFYGTQKTNGSHLPAATPEIEVVAACDEATHAFEAAMYELNLHEALSIAENFGREAHKRWDAESKAAQGSQDTAKLNQALANAFRALRTLTLLMHPATPHGSKKIAEYLRIPPELFFSWEHAYKGCTELVDLMGETVEEHELIELPPRTDFFKKHESQWH